MTPWVPCDCCDEFLCNIHGGHVSECECPPIDEWVTDPYDAISKQEIINENASRTGSNLPWFLFSNSKVGHSFGGLCRGHLADNPQRQKRQDNEFLLVALCWGYCCWCHPCLGRFLESVLSPLGSRLSQFVHLRVNTIDHYALGP